MQFSGDSPLMTDHFLLMIMQLKMGYSKKNQGKRGGGERVDDMEFPGASKKWHVEFPAVN